MYLFTFGVFVHRQSDVVVVSEDTEIDLHPPVVPHKPRQPERNILAGKRGTENNANLGGKTGKSLR